MFYVKFLKYKKYILLFFTILQGALSSKAQWIDWGSPVTRFWSTHNVIALDTNGIVYYACTENQPSSVPKPILKKFDGTSWVSIMFEYDTLNQIEFEEALIDSNNQLNIFYRNDRQILDINNNYLYTVKQYGCKVLKSNGWHDLTGTWLDADTNQFTLHACLDRNNNVYGVITTQNNLIIKRWNGLSWTKYSNNGLPPYRYKLRIAYSEGNTYLALLNTATFSTEVYVYNQNEWIQIGSFNSGNAEVKLLNTPNNKLYLTYKNKCVQLNKTTLQWQDIGPSMENIFGDEYDFRCDEKSNLFVCTSALASQEAKCFYFDGIVWVNIDNRVSENIAGETRLAVYDNQLYVGYNDFILSKAIVRKHDLNLGTAVLKSSDVFAYYSNQSLWIRNNKMEVLNLEILTIEGIRVFTKQISNDLNAIKLENLTNGIYLARIKDIQNSDPLSFKFVKTN
jgi:hypothetical protein